MKTPKRFLALALCGAALCLSGCLASADEPLKIGWDDSQTGVHYRLEQAPYVEHVGPLPPVEPAWTLTRDFIPAYLGPLRPAPQADDQGVDLGIFPTGRYVFRVFAVLTNSGLESAPSETLQVDIRPGAPGLPRRVQIVLQASSNLKEWQQVATVERDLAKAEFYRTVISILE